MRQGCAARARQTDLSTFVQQAFSTESIAVSSPRECILPSCSSAVFERARSGHCVRPWQPPHANLVPQIHHESADEVEDLVAADHEALNQPHVPAAGKRYHDQNSDEKYRSGDQLEECEASPALH